MRIPLRLVSLLCLAALAAGCGRAPIWLPKAPLTSALQAASVPSGFMWGVSTAGYQWEGGDQTSDWAHWDQAGKTSERNPNGADGWNRYAEDADLTRGLGCNTFRLSIEWSRIEPREGQYDPVAIAHYHDVLNALRARGLEPVVTLMHFAYPSWLDAEGGWENPDVVQKFAHYVDFVSREYGSQVRYYLTYNEPNVFLLAGWVVGSMPPGKQNPLAGMRALQNLVAAHQLAYQAIHANVPNAMVSFNMYAATYSLRESSFATLDLGPVDRVSDAKDHLGSGTYFMDQVVGQDKLSRDGDDHGTLDFASIDYYCRLRVGVPFNLPRADQWEVDPQGFYDAMKSTYNKYNLPVFIAENGLATWDLQSRTDRWTRSAYLVAHVQEVQRAISDGIPVIGYTQWSITDNYEWGSFSPRFGLYSVDCRGGNFTRVPADGVDATRAITAAGGVTPAIAKRFPAPIAVIAPLEPGGGSAVHSW